MISSFKILLPVTNIPHKVSLLSAVCFNCCLIVMELNVAVLFQNLF